MNRTCLITTWIVNCAALIIVQASSAQTQSAIPIKPIGLDGFSVMREFFNYDRGIPLEARMVDQDSESEYVREKLVFRGIGNSRVPGYLAIPTNGDAPYPCVFLIHGIGRSKEDWWSDGSFHSRGILTKTLLKSGIAVMTLDVEYHGERLANNDFEFPEVFLFQKGWSCRARDMIVRSAVEHRRAIDYLGTRKEIDASEIGTVGYSMVRNDGFRVGCCGRPNKSLSGLCYTDF